MNVSWVCLQSVSSLRCHLHLFDPELFPPVKFSRTVYLFNDHYIIDFNNPRDTMGLRLYNLHQYYQSHHLRTKPQWMNIVCR